MNLQNIRFAFVKLVYGDHNRSNAVRNGLKLVMENLEKNEIGLNVGAGTTKFGENFKNLDIFPGENIDYVGKAENIPVPDNYFKIVITQETLEHVENPIKAINEIYRVLKPGGILYCQLPFIIGYHPGPTDFWRFTKEGIVELVESGGFKVELCNISVGPSTGFYRICVEYWSILFSFLIPPAYHILKAFFALLFFPIKWLDFFLIHSRQKHRIPGGYFVIARKELI